MSRTPSRAAPANVEIDGDAVRDQRKRLGKSITDMAPEASMSVGYLSQIERGRRPTVSPKYFLQLAKALGLADRPHLIMKRHRRSAA